MFSFLSDGMNNNITESSRIRVAEADMGKYIRAEVDASWGLVSPQLIMKDTGGFSEE